MDVELIMGVAPGVKTEFWYFNTGYFCNDLKTWTDAILITPESPLVYSVSYCAQTDIAELGCSDAIVASIDDNFSKIAAKGITILIASGDSGSGYTNLGGMLMPGWPTSSPWVTSVGGTRFVDYPKVGGEEMATNLFGSGGGFSRRYPQSPNAAWQSDMVAAYLKGAPQLPPAGSFPPLGRGTPDVSAIGVGYPTYVGGIEKEGGGTSASAPIFASLVSLLNEARLAAKMPAMGFLNPFLYKNADAFFDVVKGNNRIGRDGDPIRQGYNCTKGWDPATGLGTPHFGKLLAAATAVGAAATGRL